MKIQNAVTEIKKVKKYLFFFKWIEEGTELWHGGTESKADYKQTEHRVYR